MKNKKIWIAIGIFMLALCISSCNQTKVNDQDPHDEREAQEQTQQHVHTLSSAVKENVVESTCENAGSYDEVVYCSVCNEEVSRTSKSLAMLAHTPSSSVKENLVDPTCAKEGSYDEVVYCAVCNGEASRTSKSIAMLAHQYQDKKCTACGADQPSEGLEFLSKGNGMCTVAGIGSCTDEDVIIPAFSPSGEKVIQIAAYAFSDCTGVKRIRIPETVAVIEEGAFQECPDLVSVTLPSKITMISDFTFKNCKNLKDVTIPTSVTQIGEEAFAGCVACESIVIPASVEVIEKNAFRNFSGCDGTVKFEKSKKWWCYDSFGKVDIGNFGYLVLTDEREAVRYITFRYTEYTWKCE